MKRLSLISILLLFICLPCATQNRSPEDFFIAEGSMDLKFIHSPSLVNNKLGDTPERSLAIYLPPGYENASDSHYPVIYLFHGYMGNQQNYFRGEAYGFNLKYMLDTLINRNILTPLIVVCPDAYNKYWGSWYTNSSVTGMWEDFIVKDLVAYMDSHYRTLAYEGGRGISGHSMGGYGSFKIGMKHPGIFSSVYPMSGVLDLGHQLTNNRSSVLKASQCESFTAAEYPEKIMISEAAAFAPDSTSLPLYGRFPLDDSGELIDSVWARWMEHDPFSMLDSFKDSIAKLRALQFDCGTEDVGIYDENVNISEKMTGLGIDHVFLDYEGDHMNRIQERIRNYMLPFFSKQLDHCVPGISRISSSYLLAADTLVVKVDQDVMVYLVPEFTIASVESINKSQLDSRAGEANSEIRFPLSAFESGHYVAYAIGDEPGGISIPLPFVVDSKLTPPGLTVIMDSVARGDSIFAKSDKDGILYLTVRGTTPDQIPSRRVKAEVEVKAGLPAGLATEGLPRGDYLVYAMDQVGQFSESCQACIAEGVGQESYRVPGIKLYPNPTDGHMNITTDSPGYYTLQIKALNGQELLSTNFQGSLQAIDLSSFKAGVYIITICSEDLLITRKIVRY